MLYFKVVWTLYMSSFVQITHIFQEPRYTVVTASCYFSPSRVLKYPADFLKFHLTVVNMTLQLAAAGEGDKLLPESGARPLARWLSAAQPVKCCKSKFITRQTETQHTLK